MPLPRPGRNEDEQEFINRCMGDQVMTGEYEEAGQRRAVCQSIWDRQNRRAEMPEQMKVFKLENIKLGDENEGTFEAEFATLDAIDKDGDSYDPGAVGNQNVMISQWNHGSWGTGVDALPLGVGKTSERGNKAIISGEFDMGDDSAVKTYRKLKYLKEKGFPVEWSFALPKTEYRVGERNGQDNVRIYTSIEIPEVSPVLMGAGIDTRLLSIKSKYGGDHGVQFAEEAGDVQTLVADFVTRCQSIVELRKSQDKEPLSEKARGQIEEVEESLSEALESLKALKETPAEEGTGELDAREEATKLVLLSQSIGA